MRTLLLALMFLGCGTSETVEPTPEDDCPLPKEDPRFIELATDGHAVMALRSDGRAVCWGEDTEGQCGFDWAGGELEPTLSKAPKCVTSISIDGNGSAILADGRLGVWGQEDSSQFGDGKNVTQSYGEMVIVPIDEPVVSAALYWAYAVTEDGGIYCWGPVCGSEPQFDPIPYPWPGRAVMVAADGPNCVLDDEGSVFCKGSNKDGEVGDGTLEPRSQYTKTVLPGPATYITAHLAGACAVLRNGEVACWGRDSGSVEPMPTPKLVEGVSGVAKVRLSRNGGACAFAVGGTATCWGSGMAAHLPGSPSTRTPRRFELYDDVLDMALSGADGCVLRASDHWVYCVGNLRAARYDEHEEYEALKEFRPIPKPTE